MWAQGPPHLPKECLTDNKEPTMKSPTMKPEDLGPAKKYRNSMRERVHKDLQLMSTKYGISLFEAAHAVLDTVLCSIDASAAHSGGCSMSNQVAQTLLPYTEEMLGKTTESPTTHVLGKPSPHSTTGKNKPVVTKKLDKHVTQSDCLADILWYGQNGKTAKQQQKEALESFQGVLPGCYVVTGGGWLGPSNPCLPGVSGNVLVVVSVPKHSPYVTAFMHEKLHLSVPPTGNFKWRKLKNKSIYKLQDYSKGGKSPSTHNLLASSLDTPLKPPPKSVSTVTATSHKVGVSVQLLVSTSIEAGIPYNGGLLKVYSQLPEGYFFVKNPSKNQGWVMKTCSGLTLPMQYAMNTPAPWGFHWETLVGSPQTSHAVLVKTKAYHPNGSPVLSTKGAEFPPSPMANDQVSPYTAELLPKVSTGDEMKTYTAEDF